MDVTLSQYRLYYKRLAVKLACAIVVVAVVPLVIMAAFSRHFFVGSYKDKVLEHLESLVRHQEHIIGSFMTERIEALGLIGMTTSLGRLSDETVLQDRLVALKKTYGEDILGLALLDREGKPIAAAGAPAPRGPERPRGDDAEKDRAGGYYVGDVYEDGAGLRCFSVGVQVGQSEGNRILAAVVAAEALNRLLEESGLSRFGREAVFSSRGTLLASSVAGSAPSDWKCGEDAPPEAKNPRVPNIRESGDGSTLCVTKNLGTGGWELRFVANTDDVFRAFSQPRLFALSTLLLGIAGIVAVSIFVADRASKYVARFDQERQLINEQVVQAGKLAALGEMASGMAHEINNPVGIMVGEAQLIESLLEQGEEGRHEHDSEIRDSLREIQSQGKRCRDIILQLITLTQTGEPVAEELQLNEVIQEITGLCRQRAHAMNVELRLVPEPSLPAVTAASSDVRQVLINLINNSLDAMEQVGGTIEIRTGARGRYAIVDVADTGPGISLEHLGRIFEPLFSTKPEGKGTGLGLPICHSLMKKMKGDITVNSRIGEGTAFHLFFPLRDETNSV